MQGKECEPWGSAFNGGSQMATEPQVQVLGLLPRLWLSWLPALHIVHVIVNIVYQAVTIATISGAS